MSDLEKVQNLKYFYTMAFLYMLFLIQFQIFFKWSQTF